MSEQSNAKKAVPPVEVLRFFYETERLSLAEAGARLGVSSQTFYRWLKDTPGIRARTKGEARLVAKRPDHSEETLEKMRERAAAMRAKITPESHAKQAAKMMGRTPGNKGGTWTPEQREKITAQRADPAYRAMMSEKLRGEKSPRWKGGVKSEANRRLDSAFWRRRRLECYARDNWTCQDCGRKCKNSADSKSDGGTKIQAHHIVSRRDGGSDDLDNLTTLCMSCHHRRERSDQRSA
jgi:transposase